MKFSLLSWRGTLRFPSLSPSWFVLPIGIFIVTIMSYSLVTGSRMAERHAPMQDAVMEIKFKAALAHLWFEELISGDRYTDISIVWKNLDESAWYANAMLEGGKNTKGTFVPLTNPLLRHEIEDVLAKIKKFRIITEKRWASRAQSGIGTNIDQRLDELFKDFIKQADKVETVLKSTMAKELYRFRVVQILLIILILGLSAAVAIIFLRYEQRQLITIKALSDNEARFRAIYENAPVLINAFDDKGDCILWNKQCQKTFGWSQEEINAQDDALTLFYPDPAIRDEVLRTMTEDPDGNFREWYPKTKEGKTLITMWTNFLLSDGISFSLGYDITAQKESEKALRESESRFRTLFEHAPDAMFLNDYKGIFIDCNLRAEKLSGCTHDELIGKSFSDFGLLQQNKSSKTRRIMIKARSGRATGPDEVIMTGSDGKSVYIEISSIPVVINGCCLILGIAHDISKRKQVEEELLENKEKFQTIAKVAQDAIIMLDSTGHIQLWNPSAEKIFGYRADQVEGQLLAELIIPERYRNAHQKGLARFKETGQSHLIGSIVELSALNAEGIEFPVEISLSGLKKTGDSLTVGFIRDITERKKREAKLKGQLNELHRWQEVVVDREGRNIELKAQINALLAELGRSIRYHSVEKNGEKHV